jgi:predicted Fe-Mo cluster-binding NifX family protein
MRIAISSDGDQVSSHFGRCPTFTVVDIEQGKAIKRDSIDNPGHQPGFIPKFLHEKGVQCIVSGGMGARAIQLFTEFNIKTILGVSGSIEEVIGKLEQGTLKSGESVCKGEGKGDCYKH